MICEGGNPGQRRYCSIDEVIDPPDVMLTADPKLVGAQCIFLCLKGILNLSDMTWQLSPLDDPERRKKVIQGLLKRPATRLNWHIALKRGYSSER